MSDAILAAAASFAMGPISSRSSLSIGMSASPLLLHRFRQSRRTLRTVMVEVMSFAKYRSFLRAKNMLGLKFFPSSTVSGATPRGSACSTNLSSEIGSSNECSRTASFFKATVCRFVGPDT
eukprot:2101962-Prymnesium_polylepis.1